MVTNNEELQSLLDELGRELQQAKAQLGEERKTSYDLRTQLEVQCTVYTCTCTVCVSVSVCLCVCVCACVKKLNCLVVTVS